MPSDPQLLPPNIPLARKGKQKEGQRELQPWDPRPWPESGDDNEDVTFAAVGRALTEWARFETALSRLFAGFIAIDRDSKAARRAFGAVRTFEGRMDMIRAAAISYFSHFPDEPLKATWDDLAKRAKLFGERRNEIAHGAVIFGR